MSKISLQVNGKPVSGEVEGNTRLLDFVRDSLDLTGTKEGCAVGECGACTVIMNGDAVCTWRLLSTSPGSNDFYETPVWLDSVGRVVCIDAGRLQFHQPQSCTG